MILEHAELHQICQHEHLAFDFKPGLVGIFGPNGAGKSNFVNMLKASLTGDFSVNPGVKDDNIRWGIPDDDYSAITSVWNHEGQQFTVRRGLKNIHNLLTVAGQPGELRGAKEINAKIESIIGLPKQILNFIFVEQWQMFAFVSADPAERANMFAHLCGTALVEKAYNVLGDQIKADQALTVDMLDTRKDRATRILERQARIVEMENSITTFKKKILGQSKGEQYTTLLKTAEKYNSLTGQLQRLKTRSEVLVTECAVADKELKIAQKLYDSLHTNVETLQTEAEEARHSLALYKDQQKKRDRLKELEDVLAEKGLPPPPEPACYLKQEALNRRSADLKADIDLSRKVIKTFADTGLTACPTCATPVSAFSAQIPALKKALPVLEKELQRINDDLLACKNYEGALAVYDRQRSQQVNRKDMAKVEMASIKKELSEVAVDPAKLEAVIAEHKNKAAELSGYERRLRTAETAYNTKQGMLAQCEEEIATIEGETTGLAVSSKKVAEAEQALAEHRNAKSEVRILEARIGDLVTANKVESEEIARIEAVMARTKVARDWLTELSDSREFAHRNNFPRLAAQRWLENMVDKINATLEQFESPFYVEADEDLSFIAVKPSGRRERAERLSGGQKVLLALAFRFAVNSLLAGDVGMMILDEPTAGVDKANIANLTDVLTKVADFTKDKGMQLLVITHDESLQRAFDQVVHIDQVT